LGYGVRPIRRGDQLHLGQSDAKGASAPRCQFSGDLQTRTLLDGNHVLSVFFNGAFWSRLLTALDAANLFATSMTKIGVLHLNGQSGSLEDRAHGHLSSFCTMWAQFGICLLPGGGGREGGCTIMAGADPTLEANFGCLSSRESVSPSPPRRLAPSLVLRLPLVASPSPS